MSTGTTTIPRPSLRDRFRKLADQWKDDSRFLSNSAQMAMLRPYQQIIGLGEPAVPFILEELRRETDHWFWALEAITQENPVLPQDAGRVEKMAEAWIEWGVREGHLSR